MVRQLSLFGNNSEEPQPQPKKKSYDLSKMNAYGMHRMCTRKKKYRTLEYAEKAAWFLSQKFGKQQKPYWCPLCHCYHLTSQT